MSLVTAWLMLWFCTVTKLAFPCRTFKYLRSRFQSHTLFLRHPFLVTASNTPCKKEINLWSSFSFKLISSCIRTNHKGALQEKQGLFSRSIAKHNIQWQSLTNTVAHKKHCLNRFSLSELVLGSLLWEISTLPIR